jgi:hypothetical protein
MAKSNTRAAYKLMDMVGAAIDNIKLETWTPVSEISLYTELHLAKNVFIDKDLYAYAISRMSVTCTNGEHVKIMQLDADDILTLQGLIKEHYGIDF